MNPSAPTPFAPGLNIQGFTAPLRLHDFKLIAFDMDSTLINIECVDEIADAAGRKAEVAAITEAAMRGEIKDYKDSLRQRVALLQGVPESALHEVYQHRLRLNPGAQALVQACQRAGLKTLLVSGSRAAWWTKTGAIFATAKKSAASWRSLARNWALHRPKPLPWATAPTICP